MRSPQSRGSVKRFVPSLERLEDRQLLSCSASLPTPEQLVIECDGGNDAVVVRDYGDGSLDGSASGYGDFSFGGITDIVIDSGGGKDRVAYNLVRDLQPETTHRVEVNLRDGNDEFTATLRNERGPTNLLANSLLLMKAVGEAGNDKLVLDAEGVTMDHGTMKITYFGGSGNDHLDMAYRGHNDHGGVSFFADGEDGNDGIKMSMVADPTSDAPAPGGFRGIIEAGAGNDRALLHVAAPSAVSTAQVSIDGGDGIDTAVTDIDPVNVSNCETLLPL